MAAAAAVQLGACGTRWPRADAAACRAAQEVGACWGVVAEKYRLILFGRYPYEEQWRPLLATRADVALLVASCTARVLEALAGRRCGWRCSALFLVLMYGGVLGLSQVETDALGRPAADASCWRR